jgi:molybdate transport system regulatory protein
MIRLARAMELLRENTSPKKIEQLLGLSLPPRSHEQWPSVAKRPSSTPRPATSPPRTGIKTVRNCFIGKIVAMQRDSLQSQVQLLTPAGHPMSAMVTNDSAERLGLKPDRMVVAEIKEHAVSLQVQNNYATTSIDNCFTGNIIGLTRGPVSWECVVDIGGGTTVYALLSAHYAATLELKLGKTVGVAFNSFSLILHIY